MPDTNTDFAEQLRGLSGDILDRFSAEEIKDFIPEIRRLSAGFRETCKSDNDAAACASAVARVVANFEMTPLAAITKALEVTVSIYGLVAASLAGVYDLPAEEGAAAPEAAALVGQYL